MEESYDPSNYQYRRCYKVNLIDQTCDCGEFQAKKFPYAYVFVAYTNVSLEPTQFMNCIFQLNAIMNIYNNEFRPIGDVIH